MAAGGRYRVEIKPSAGRSLGLTPPKDRVRIARKIDALAADPRPHRCEKLEGADDVYRVRSGDYRILYQVRDDVLLVLVVRVAHRREAYRNL